MLPTLADKHEAAAVRRAMWDEDQELAEAWHASFVAMREKANERRRLFAGRRNEREAVRREAEATLLMNAPEIQLPVYNFDQ